MSQDPFQALYSGIGGALLLHLTTIESIYPTLCVCEFCVCVSKFFVDKLCVSKLCVSKLCVDKLCV